MSKWFFQGCFHRLSSSFGDKPAPKEGLPPRTGPPSFAANSAFRLFLVFRHGGIGPAVVFQIKFSGPGGVRLSFSAFSSKLSSTGPNAPGRSASLFSDSPAG